MSQDAPASVPLLNKSEADKLSVRAARVIVDAANDLRVNMDGTKISAKREPTPSWRLGKAEASAHESYFSLSRLFRVQVESLQRECSRPRRVTTAS